LEKFKRKKIDDGRANLGIKFGFFFKMPRNSPGDLINNPVA